MDIGFIDTCVDCCNAYHKWINAQASPWWPAVCFKGFGGSGFISFTSTINIAIARWEAFRKSLMDVQGDFDKLFEKILLQQRSASMLADERFTKEFELCQVQCSKSLVSLKTRNQSLWRYARKFAWGAAILGGILLFFQLSTGWLALFMFIAPVLTVYATRTTRKRLKYEIVNKVIHECQRIAALQELNKTADAQHISETIDRANSDESN